MTARKPLAAADNDECLVGVVAIGRNEGARLVRCLESLHGIAVPVVYVDSGSTDGSPEVAHEFGVEVVALDSKTRFSAARARNAGAERLLQLVTSVEAIQFLDGDCEIEPSWLSAAWETLRSDSTIGAVCGRRREIYRDATIYNRMCDIEWDTPVGVAKSFGGDVLIRTAAFRDVQGYDPSVISAEDDEISMRLRKAQWKILRIDYPMSAHDAAMDSFGQWWRRAVRTGHAYAQGFAMHGSKPLYHFKRQLVSVLVWGSLLPASVLLAPLTRGYSFLLLLGYVLVAAKSTLHTVRKKHVSFEDGLLYGIFCALGKCPEMMGVLKYGTNQLLGRPARIIEYKGPTESSAEQHRRPSAIPAPHLKQGMKESSTGHIK